MSEIKEEVSLENGKYRFYIQDSLLKCARYSDTNWRDFIGDNAVYSLFMKCLETEQRLKALLDEKKNGGLIE